MASQPLAGFILLGSERFCQENWSFVVRAFKRFGVCGFVAQIKKMVPRAGVEPAWVVKPGGF